MRHAVAPSSLSTPPLPTHSHPLAILLTVHLQLAKALRNAAKRYLTTSNKLPSCVGHFLSVFRHLPRCSCCLNHSTSSYTWKSSSSPGTLADKHLHFIFALFATDKSKRDGVGETRCSCNFITRNLKLIRIPIPSAIHTSCPPSPLHSPYSCCATLFTLSLSASSLHCFLFLFICNCNGDDAVVVIIIRQSSSTPSPPPVPPSLLVFIQV